MKRITLQDYLITACTIMVIFLWLFAIAGYDEIRAGISKAQQGIERNDSLHRQVDKTHKLMLMDLDTIKRNTNGK